MRKQKKPGFLCVANWPSDVGYAWWLMESYWVAIANSFSDRYDCFLVYPEINKVPLAVEESELILVECDFTERTLKGLLKQIRFLYKNKIECIYLTDNPLYSYRYLIFKLCGVRVIVSHDHTPGQRSLRNRIAGIIKTAICKAPLINVDAAFAATDFVKTRLIKTSCFPAHKCFSIQNGISPNYKKADIPELDILKRLKSQNKFVVLTSARANRYKGYDFGIQVIAELVKRGWHDITYVCCGDGPDLDEFKRYAETLGITKNCHFLGRVEHVRNLYPVCDVGFQPSKGEVGYSLSILEYMIAGMPVIVPDNPSVCLLTQEGSNGFVYAQDNVVDAADKFSHYLSNRELVQEHGDRARELVVEKYTLSTTHKTLVDTLNLVIK